MVQKSGKGHTAKAPVTDAEFDLPGDLVAAKREIRQLTHGPSTEFRYAAIARLVAFQQRLGKSGKLRASFEAVTTGDDDGRRRTDRSALIVAYFRPDLKPAMRNRYCDLLKCAKRKKLSPKRVYLELVALRGIMPFLRKYAKPNPDETRGKPRADYRAAVSTAKQKTKGEVIMAEAAKDKAGKLHKPGWLLVFAYRDDTGKIVAHRYKRMSEAEIGRIMTQHLSGID